MLLLIAVDIKQQMKVAWNVILCDLNEFIYVQSHCINIMLSTTSQQHTTWRDSSRMMVVLHGVINGIYCPCRMEQWRTLTILPSSKRESIMNAYLHLVERMVILSLHLYGGYNTIHYQPITCNMERQNNDDGGVTRCHKWHILPMQDEAMSCVDHLAIKQKKSLWMPTYTWLRGWSLYSCMVDGYDAIHYQPTTCNMERQDKDDSGVVRCRKWHLLLLQDKSMAYIDHLIIKRMKEWLILTILLSNKK